MPIVFALSDEQGEQVMKMMAEHGASIRRACLKVGIGATSFLRWKEETEERKERYARARQDQIDCWADELIDIADDNSRDVYTTEEGREIVDTDVIARARLRVDTRKFMLSKLARGTYGESVDHKVSGNITINVTSYAPPLIEGEAETVKLVE